MQLISRKQQCFSVNNYIWLVSLEKWPYLCTYSEHSNQIHVPRYESSQSVFYQGFSEAWFGASNRPLSQSRKKQCIFAIFSWKVPKKVDENPKFTLVGMCDKNRCVGTLPFKRKTRIILVSLRMLPNFRFMCLIEIVITHEKYWTSAVAQSTDMCMCCLWSLRRWRFSEKWNRAWSYF